MRDLISRWVAGLGAVCVAAAVLGAPSASAAEIDTVEWAALGDSYTAGVFVGAPQPALGDSGRDGCDRTTNSYPDLVSRNLTASPPDGRTVNLTDVSCGGATIADITTNRQTPISPVQPPADGWDTVAPQVERAGLNADTDLVTIGAGGNSLPVAAMLISCLVGGFDQPDDATPCRDAYQSGDSIFDPEPIDDKYDRIVREYAAMLAEVHRKAPNATVITIGYPTVVPADPSGCDRQDTTMLAARIKNLGLLSVTHGDIAWLSEVLTRLNTTIQAVTELSGDTYVDAAGPSNGKDLCRPAGDKHVEGVCGQAADYWPAELPLGVFTLECPTGTRATLLHPSAAGHASTATQLETAIRTALG